MGEFFYDRVMSTILGLFYMQYVAKIHSVPLLNFKGWQNSHYLLVKSTYPGEWIRSKDQFTLIRFDNKVWIAIIYFDIIHKYCQLTLNKYFFFWKFCNIF